MAAVRMQKGGLVTHVYNDPETIADAEKKGFRPVDAVATEPVGGTDATADATAQDTETPELAAGNRNRRRSSG